MARGRHVTGKPFGGARRAESAGSAGAYSDFRKNASRGTGTCPKVTPCLATLWLFFNLPGCTGTMLYEAVEERRFVGRFHDIGTIERVIPLREPVGIGLGVITKVVSYEGMFYVSDIGSADRVATFDENGEHHRVYSLSEEILKRGEHLRDFEVTGAGLFLLSDRQLTRIDRQDGSMRASAMVPAYPKGLAAVGDWICVMSLPTQGLTCFDGTLRPAALRAYGDDRLLKFALTPSRPVSSVGSKQVSVAEFFAPRLRLFDVPGEGIRGVAFPLSKWDENGFSALWTGDVSSQQTQGLIRSAVRRFNRVLPMPDGRLMLFDLQGQPEVREIVLFDPGAMTAVRFDGAVATLDVPSLRTRTSVFDLLVGTGARGMVGIIRNEDVAHSMKVYVPSQPPCSGAWQCLFLMSVKLQ